MGCYEIIAEPMINVQFRLKKEAQQLLVDYILSYSQLEFKSLAVILEVSPLILSQVLAGKSFLEHEKANNLFQYFIMLISH